MIPRRIQCGEPHHATSPNKKSALTADFLYAKKIKLYFLLSFPEMTKMYNAERPTSP